MTTHSRMPEASEVTLSTRSHLFFLMAMLFGLQFVGCSSKSKPEPSPEPEEAAIDYQGLYFLGNDGTGTGLYRTDITGSLTLLVKDIQPGEVHSQPREFVRVGLDVLFFTEGNTGRQQLWKTNGTEAGTPLVKEFHFTGPLSCGILQVKAVSDQEIFFDHCYRSQDLKLWKSDGTEEGTVPAGDTYWLWDIDHAKYGYLGNEVVSTVVNGELQVYLSTNKNALFVSDGTPSGLRLLTDRRCPDHPLLFEGDAAFYFVCPGDTSLHHQLWKSDSAGEVLLADFLSAEPANFEAAGGNVYFSTCCVSWVINGTIHEHWQLWKYDGVQLSNFLISGSYQPEGLHAAYVDRFAWPDLSAGGPLYTGALPFGSSDFTVAGNTFFFLAAGGLWKGDATGTQLVKTFASGAFTSITDLLSVGDSIYFRVEKDNSRTLWKSDGTEAGTVLVSDPALRTMGPRIGDMVFFVTTDGEHGTELWKADAQGAAVLKDINPGPASSYPEELTAIGSRLYFAADDGVHGMEPWTSDGTTEGTVLLKDVGVVGGDTDLAAMLLVKQQAYLKMVSYKFYPDPWNPRSNWSGGEVSSLWRTDGTPEGTVELRDIDSTSDFALLGDELFFAYSYGQDPAENGLWKTDGTPEGTVQVLGSICLRQIIAAGKKIFFLDDLYHLWVSDGETNGTALVPDIDYAALPGQIDSIFGSGDLVSFCIPIEFIHGSWPISISRCWVTDGKTTEEIDATHPPSGGGEVISHSIPPYGFALGPWIMFINDFGGTTLWRSDGTEEGTIPVKDFCAPLDATRCGFAGLPYWQAAGGILYFVVRIGDDGCTGSVICAGEYLWKSDGTEEGTVPVDIPGINLKFRWNSFFALDDRLVFAASDGDGSVWSIWRSDGTAEGTMPLTPRLTIQSFDSFEKVGQSVYFIADDGEAGRELWKTDGTLEGTGRITDLWPGKGNGVRWGWPNGYFPKSGILGRGP